jgi:hypothetical protein
MNSSFLGVIVVRPCRSACHHSPSLRRGVSFGFSSGDILKFGLAWRRKAIFCGPLHHELSIGRRLAFKLRFYLWIGFFCSKALELKRVP